MEIKNQQGQPYLYQKKQTLSKRSVTRDKEGHYIMVKRSVYQANITNVNIFAYNMGAPKYTTKQVLIDLQ